MTETPVLATPHATQRPSIEGPTPAPTLQTTEAPAPTLQATEAPSPADLPTVIEPSPALPAPADSAKDGDLLDNFVEEATDSRAGYGETAPDTVQPAADIATPEAASPPTDPAPAVPAASIPAIPLQPSTPAFPDPEPAAAAAPAGAEQPLQPAPAAAEPARTAPEVAPAATPPDQAPEEPLKGLFDEPADLFDEPIDQAAPASETPQEADQPAPASEQPQEEEPDDLGESLFDDARHEQPTDQGPAAGGLASKQLRRWTDNTGSYSCQGRLLQVDRTAVRILKQNGRTATVPLQRLSQVDLGFVRAEAFVAAVGDDVRLAQQ